MSSSISTKLSGINAKSTKEQILAAYQEALNQLKSKQFQDPVVEKKQLDDKALIQKVSQTTSETIIAHIAQLKLSLSQHFDTLNDKLIIEASALRDIQKAIALEQEYLANLYGIKDSLHTFSALITAQQEQKEAFEREVEKDKAAFETYKEEKKAAWKKELAALETHYAEVKQTYEKKRVREEEEYLYNLELNRRNEQQAYTLEKEKLEKELAEKRQNIALQEGELAKRTQEFTELQHRVAAFPQELSDAIKHTTETVTEQLEQSFAFKMQLREQETKGEQMLSQQKIAALEKQIQEQEARITQLTQKADAAIHQVESIACRALETSSQRHLYSSEVKQPSSQERLEK